MNLPTDYLYRIYCRRDRGPVGARLSPYQWRFWVELDGRRTVLELAHAIQYPEIACQGALASLLSAGLAEELLLTYTEYSGQVPMSGSGSVRRLDDVIRFITSRSGNGIEAKFAVYRVFLQVPPALLQAEGLTTLAFNDKPVEIRSPELRAAISEATRRIVGESFDWNSAMLEDVESKAA